MTNEQISSWSKKTKVHFLNAILVFSRMCANCTPRIVCNCSNAAGRVF